VSFFVSLIGGYRWMMKSSEKQMDEELDDFGLWKKRNKIDKLPEPEKREKFIEWLTAYEQEKDKKAKRESEPLTDERIDQRWAYLEKASEHYEVEEPTKFEQWLDDKLGDKIFGALMVLTMIISLILCMALFLYLPRWLTSLIPNISAHRILRSCIEGVIKMAIFHRLHGVDGADQEHPPHL